MGALAKYGKKALGIVLLLAFCIIIVPPALLVMIADRVGLLGE